MYNGIINVYKEKGYTSHDVVARLRGILKQKKIGHTGTLDPDAEGVLLVCLGNATKVCGLLTDKDKVYEAVIRLGVETDTQDASGKILKEQPADLSDPKLKEALMEAADHFTGSYDQVPPMYSALKVNGKKLYELAREGRTVERKARPVTIYSITPVDRPVGINEAAFRVHCSKGTYIRTLCHDMGQRVGCGACMAGLTRVKVGAFSIEDARTLDAIAAKAAEGTFEDMLIPVDRLFLDCPALFTDQDTDKGLYNGNPLKIRSMPEQDGEPVTPSEGTRVRVYDSRGVFRALYRYDKEQSVYKSEKMFL